MFVRQPQFRNSNADVQIFYGQGGNDFGSPPIKSRSWNKPPGVSHVYMLLIGGGGNGDSAGTGGGSGAVTVWYGAAQNVPDTLFVWCGGSNGSSYVSTDASLNYYLVANASTSTSGAGTTASNYFAASGFYQSVAGQNGSSGTASASTTTFLGYGGPSVVNSNYGYTHSTLKPGFFMLQPIIVGIGGSGSEVGGIGCGGGDSGTGGPGMVLIASW